MPRSFIITLITLFTLTHSPALSQKVYTLHDLFTDTEITWYGIDYTRSEMVGTFGEKDLHDYYKGWNTLILVEAEKYNVAAALQRSRVNFDVTSVSKLNELSTPNIRFVPSDSTLRKSDIAAMVAAYESIKSEGIGIVFIAERYNKKKNRCTHRGHIRHCNPESIDFTTVYNCGGWYRRAQLLGTYNTGCYKTVGCEL